eukprot:GHUV01002946.1.p1 GENE.GHUV01002946.1~~GHUV01002946.1.p1  ORF type:complete len:495 (+),score=188.21 GHUV01002946.1:1356-2840(+)
MPMSAVPELDHDPLAENGQYVQLKTLGKGSFGFVVQARNTGTQEVVAIKLLPRAGVTKYVESELVNHSLLRHPHVVQFKEVFLTRKFICIVMEYATGGTLFQYVQKLGRLKEAVARWFFQQLVVGVDYCHRRGVANRDIKLENTLLQEVPRLPLPLAKICDFGYSKAENKSAAKSKVGTLTYMAPEVLININRDGQYSGKVADIWSCGVMLFVMLCGKYPFDSPNASGVIATPNDFICMLERMVGRQYTIPPEISISPECEDLLSRLLLPEPHKRITVREIMQHPWYLNNLPPEAASMNEKYLKAAPSHGRLPPEGIRRLLQEAHLGSQCRIDTRLPPAHQAAVVMQLVAADQRSQQQQQQLTPSMQQQLQQLIQQQQLPPGVQQQLKQLMQHQHALPLNGATAAVQSPELVPAQPQQRDEPQQLPLQEHRAAVLQPQYQQQQQHQQHLDGLCHSRQVDEDTLMIIDSAISKQLGAGSSNASRRLQTYIKTAQP